MLLQSAPATHPWERAAGEIASSVEDFTSFLQLGNAHPKRHTRGIAGVGSDARLEVSGIVPTVAIDRGVGMEIPRVAMGTWPGSLPSNISSGELGRALSSWISLGGRHIDTAYVYRNQDTVGKAIADAMAAGAVTRDELFVTSKVSGPLGYEKTKQQVLKETLPALGLKYVNLLLMHWPCQHDLFDKCSGKDFLEDRVQTWRALEELRAAGVVQNIGVSNFHVPHLESLFEAVRTRTGQPPNATVNQVPFNIRSHDEALLAWCQQHGIVVEAYSPLGGTDSGLSAMKSPSVIAASKAHHVSAAQVALRWVLQKGVVVVTSSTKPEHMSQDLTPLFDFSLTHAEMTVLSGLGSSASRTITL